MDRAGAVAHAARAQPAVDDDAAAAQPQRGIFERIGEEIGQVENLSMDNQRYFERVFQQLNRVVDGIDAAADSMAKLMDLTYERDEVLADGGGDDLPAADLPDRLSSG